MTDPAEEGAAAAARSALLETLRRLQYEAPGADTEQERVRALVSAVRDAADEAEESLDRAVRLRGAYHRALSEEGVPASGEDVWEDLVADLGSADLDEEADAAVERFPLALWVDRWAGRIRRAEAGGDAEERARRALVRVAEAARPE
ncbi:hypothetical protein [Nocardiopsis halophila]|uniref:hypothetical protein n=1 Tax=Nocardiopsis halophila TaxID=141692 RepID=UPI000344DE43|nr:hypothetical protein [Nocardiopsis halophila]